MSFSLERNQQFLNRELLVFLVIQKEKLLKEQYIFIVKKN